MKYKLTFETDNHEDFIQALNGCSLKTVGNKLIDQSELIRNQKPSPLGSLNQLFKDTYAEDVKNICESKLKDIYFSPDEIVKYVNDALIECSKNLVAMNQDDDNEYPFWFTEENLKAQQEALDNLHKQLANTPTTPANQIYDPGELSRALDEGYNWAIKNHPDNFKAEHEHKWQRYNGAFRSFDFCEVDGCKMNKDDDGRIWKS